MQRRHSCGTRFHLSRFKLWLLLGIITVIFTFIWLDRQLRPVISTMAASQCRVAAALAINEAIECELYENAPLYEQLYQIRYAPDGTISAVWADVAAVNTAKSRLTAAVLDKLHHLEQEEISIPLGTLLGWQLLAGRGPDISLRAIPSGFASTEFTTKLQSEGINQTMLMGYIAFHLEINAILPGFSSVQQLEDEVCISQTLVIGEVPQVFAQINSGL